MWLGLASSACFEDPRARTAWTLSEELPSAFLPLHIEGDRGYGMRMLALKNLRARDGRSRGLAASCLQGVISHLYPQPACTWPALAGTGFPLCAEGLGARNTKQEHGHSPSLPQGWVCPQASAAAAYPQKQDLLWVTSGLAELAISVHLLCFCPLPHIFGGVSPGIHCKVLEVPRERGWIQVKRVNHGQAHWKGLTLSKARHQWLLHCPVEVAWGGKKCSQGRT